MPKKLSKTQDYLKAKVIFKYDGKIDLKKLWASEEDKELSPEFAEGLSTRRK